MSSIRNSLTGKITICVVIALVVSVVANGFYFANRIRKSAYDAARDRARAVLIEAEDARSFVANLRGSGAFDEAKLKAEFTAKVGAATDKVAAARETVFFNTIPVMAAIKIAGSHAADAGFKLRVPKEQARNKANEPDPAELELLTKIRTENLPELFQVDAKAGVIRYLRPIKLSAECMVCHGVPSDTVNKDGLDLLGSKAEGWKIGEQHGAFEILYDLAPINASIRHNIMVSFGITFVVSLFSVLLLVFLVRKIVITPLRQIRDEMTAVAEGDLSVNVVLNRNDEIGELAGAVNGVVEKMRGTLTKILTQSCQVATAVGTVYGVSEEMASGAESLTMQASTVATAGEEMAATSGDIARNCQIAADSSHTAVAEGNKGAAVVRDSITIMSRIAEQVRASAGTVENLGARSDQIGEIVGTIEDIADQTNLLALNAAIEAARAGEQGRGFAVVADEVRALAERTTRATREIGEMIKSIQQETRNAVAAMNEGVQEVERGTDQATQSEQALNRIINEINDLSLQVSQIATAAEEQTATTSEISGNILAITDVGRNVAQTAQHSSREASQLNTSAEALLGTLAGFHLDEDLPLILNKAKSAHMIFTGKIRAHLSGNLSIDSNVLPSHLTCAFGKWYQGEGQHTCGGTPTFREIDEPHARVHELGKQAIQAHDAGDKAKAMALCHEMVGVSQDLIAILDRLGREYH